MGGGQRPPAALPKWKPAAPGEVGPQGSFSATGLGWQVASHLTCLPFHFGEVFWWSVLSPGTRLGDPVQLGHPGTKIKGALGQVSEGSQREGTNIFLDSRRRKRKAFENSFV